MLAQLAIEAIQRVQAKRPEISLEPSSEFECKVWRSNGFSDSLIYQLNSEFGSHAIRSWPNRFDTPSKIEFWSRVNDQFGKLDNDGLRNLGALNTKPFPTLYEWYPPGQSNSALIELDGQLWTLCDWVSGQAIETDQVNEDLVRHLATVLGALHVQSRNAFNATGSMHSNSIRERLLALKRVDYSLFQLVDQSPFLSANSLADRVKHVLAIVVERSADWQRFLSISENQSRVCHWIVRDLWRENILLDDTQRFASIVDLGASRIDWPGLDFSRLFGSLSYSRGSTPPFLEVARGDLWNDAYSAYVMANPKHDLGSLEECRMLSLVSNGLAIVQWLRWIYAGTMDLSVADKSARVSRRISEICDSFLMGS